MGVKVVSRIGAHKHLLRVNETASHQNKNTNAQVKLTWKIKLFSVCVWAAPPPTRTIVCPVAVVDMKSFRAILEAALVHDRVMKEKYGRTNVEYSVPRPAPRLYRGLILDVVSHGVSTSAQHVHAAERNSVYGDHRPVTAREQNIERGSARSCGGPCAHH